MVVPLSLCPKILTLSNNHCSVLQSEPITKVPFLFPSVVLFFVSGWCRRKRKFVPPPGRSLRAARRARQISLSAAGPSGNVGNGSVVTGAGSVSSFNWAELQRQGGSTGGSAYSTLDRRMTMETDAATLVDGTRLSPQQLGKS